MHLHLLQRSQKVEVCYANCDSPVCNDRKANCDSPGSACYDPRLIGDDGIVFYFHDEGNEHFILVSGRSHQIDGSFIGHHPAGRTRDFTWIQSLGFLFNPHTFSLEAATWDNDVDHLKLTHNSQDLAIPKGPISIWYYEGKDVKVERVSSKNSVFVSPKDTSKILVNVVSLTKEDDKIYNFQVPADDPFAHLEVQFRFFNLSSKVDAALGKTYKPDFENLANAWSGNDCFGR